MEEARKNVPLSGYDVSNLYVVPTYDEIEGKKWNHPAPPKDIVVGVGAPKYTGVVAMMRSPEYRNPSPVIRISRSTVQSLWDMTVDDTTMLNKIDKFISMSLEAHHVDDTATTQSSGSLEPSGVLAVYALGPVTGPYGTSDNTYSSASQNPVQTGFTGTVTQSMNYRADCDPRFQYISRSSARSYGYLNGYLIGTGAAPNGYPTGAGISFPANPKIGDYFLRIDYAPQLLFRWNGKMWVRISENVRTPHLDWTANNKSLISTFINNQETTTLTDGSVIPQKQALNTVLRNDNQ